MVSRGCVGSGVSSLGWLVVHRLALGGKILGLHRLGLVRKRSGLNGLVVGLGNDDRGGVASNQIGVVCGSSTAATVTAPRRKGNNENDRKDNADNSSCRKRLGTSCADVIWKTRSRTTMNRRTLVSLELGGSCFKRRVSYF